MRNVVRWVALAGALCGLLCFVLSCQRKPAEQAPAQATPAAAADLKGQQGYLAYCAVCHGERGGGGGQLALALARVGVVVARLDDKERLQRLGRPAVREVIEKGGAHTGRSNLMPMWGESLAPDLMDAIADHVMTLPGLAPGVPAATVEQYLRAPAGSPADGRRLYVFHCSGCHGPYGTGDGLNADSLRVRYNIRPRDLTDAAYMQTRSDQDLYAILALGGGHTGKSEKMPAWGYTLRPEEIKDVLSYVRTLARPLPRP